MKTKFRYSKNFIVMFGQNGHVIFYPYVLFKQPKNDVSSELFRHELQHVYQIQKHGWFKFFAKYLWYTIRYGCKKNPFEVEARKKSTKKLTIAEVKMR